MVKISVLKGKGFNLRAEPPRTKPDWVASPGFGDRSGWTTRNFCVLILTASLLQALEKQQEALLHFREAVKLAPWNFEAQKGTQVFAKQGGH